MTAVVASSAVCAPGPPAPGWVALDGNTIAEVGVGVPPRGAVDLGEALLLPAFVDLQCNGVDDIDFASADAAGWRRARSTLARRGIGSFCPTFVSAPLHAYDELLAATDRAQSEEARDVAVVLGAHLEGPFLGAAPGAHDVGCIRPVDVDWLDRIVAQWREVLRVVTLAPEADPGGAGTRRLADAGVVVALGHSRASYDEARDAAEAGASVVTHVFNGMPSLHHRSPGLVGAALTDDRLTPTLIADLVHVHPAAMHLAVACRPDAAVVSDAVALRDGVVARDGAAWLADGTLAGATTLLDESFANLVRIGVPVPLAATMVTAAPARIIGAADRGTLRPGARADVVAVDPRTLQVAGVWLAGVPVAS